MARRKNMSGVGLLLGIALLPVTVPLKMATDILKSEQRAKNKRKGRRR